MILIQYFLIIKPFMSPNLTGSIVGFVGMTLALFTHMIIKDLTNEVDFIITNLRQICFFFAIAFFICFCF